MNATVNDAAENIYKASKDAASDFRRRGGNVKDYASSELRAFLSDVDDLVKKIGNVSDADVARLRTKVANTLGDVRRSVGDTTEGLRERARIAAGITNDYVHDRPWTAIGVAAAIGLVAGAGLVTALRR